MSGKDYIIRMLNDDFDIARVTLEEISYSLDRFGGLIVRFDVKDNQRITVLFTVVSGIKFIHEHYFGYAENAQRYNNSQNIEFDFSTRRIVEIIPPQWYGHFTTIRSAMFSEYLVKDLYELRHFVIILEDFALEILAQGYKIVNRQDIEGTV